MKFYIENRGSTDNFCIRFEEGEELDSLTLGMITHNNIPGFASAVYTELNNERTVRYDISEMTSLEEYLGSIMNKKKILGIFSSVISAINICKDYLIETDSLLLDKRHVFIGKHNMKVHLICSPLELIQDEQKEDTEPDDDFIFTGEEENISEVKNIKAFFMDILFSARFDSKESGVYLKYLINYLGSDTDFRLGRFNTLIKDLQAGNPITPSDYGFDETEEAEIVSENVDRTYTVGSTPVQPAASNHERASTGFEIPGGAASESSEKKNSKEKSKGLSSIFEKKEKSSSGGFMDKLKEAVSEPSAKSDTKEQKQAKKGGFGGLFKASEKSEPEKKKGKNVFGNLEIPGEETIPNVNGLISRKNVSESGASKSEPSNQSSKQSHKEKRSNNHEASDFGKTIYKMPGEVSDDNNAVYDGELPYITRLKDGQTYLISKEEYVIGKNKDAVDCYLDNITVSRRHAIITFKNGVCKIYDLKSTNKTFVNGFKVPDDGEESAVTLQSGDRIKFSDEEFEFEYK